MQSQSLKYRSQRLLVLACYTALLVPRAHGLVLCINPCGVASVEASAHQCHAGEHEHDMSHTEHASEILASGFMPEHNHSDSCCTDVPLGAETPQLVSPSVVIPPLVRSHSDGTLSSTPAPSFCLAERAPDHPPADIDRLSSIILLI